MANEDLKAAAKKSGVFLWEIAQYFGVTDSTFSKRLRVEFAEVDKTEVRKAIGAIANSKTESGG